MKALTTALLSSVLLAGCMSTTSGLDPVVSSNGFNDSKVVDIQPHGLTCKKACLSLGAQWQQEHPEVVYLEVESPLMLMNIYSAELNVDGEILTLEPSQYMTNHEANGYEKKSSKMFLTTKAQVEDMMNAKRVWLRVKTNSGYVEDKLIDETEDSKAYNALKRFMAAI
jgi:hypothetical protein